MFFVLVCIHPGTPRVPPRVLASGPKPCGGNNVRTDWLNQHALSENMHELAFKFANLTQIEYPCNSDKRNVTVLTGDKYGDETHAGKQSSVT